MEEEPPEGADTLEGAIGGEQPVEAPPVFQVFAYVSEGSNEVALVSEHDNLDDALAACDGGLVECRTGTGATLVS